MNVAKSKLFLPHGKRLGQEIRRLSNGSGISQNKTRYIFYRFIDQEFFVVGECNQSVRGLLNDLDLIGIENKFLARIESVKPDQGVERRNLSKKKF